MLDASSFSATENEMAEAERVLNERVLVLVAGMKREVTRIEDAARIREIRGRG